MEREQKRNDSAEIEIRKKEEMLPLLHSDTRKCTNRVKEVEYYELIKEIENELKLIFLHIMTCTNL